MKNIARQTQHRPCTQLESDILMECPIQLGSYSLKLRGDQLNVILDTMQGYNLYSRNSWIHFMARFFKSKFRVQGMR